MFLGINAQNMESCPRPPWTPASWGQVPIVVQRETPDVESLSSFGGNKICRTEYVWQNVLIFFILIVLLYRIVTYLLPVNEKHQGLAIFVRHSFCLHCSV